MMFQQELFSRILLRKVLEMWGLVTSVALLRADWFNAHHDASCQIYLACL